MEKVFETYIRTTPDALWRAITDPDTRAEYNWGMRTTSPWTPGSGYRSTSPDGAGVWVEGENLEVDPPRRLVQTMRALWSDDVRRVGTTTVTYEITPIAPDSCRLVVRHELPDDAHDELHGGWPMIVSGLKTLLETGDILTTPASLRFGHRG